MKQTVLTTPSGQEILVVEVPNNTYACEIYEENLIVKRGFEFYQQWDDHKLPDGNWQGKRLEEYTSDEIGQLVGRSFKNYQPKQHLNQQSQYDTFWVKSSGGSEVFFDTKAKSFSYALKMELNYFLRSKGIDTQNNPFIALNRK